MSSARDRNRETLLVDETGAQRLLGYVLDLGQSDGRACCRLRVTDAHLNRHKVLHGGIISCVLDNAAGATASLSVDPAGRAPFMTVSMAVNYMAPAFPGSVVEAVGQLHGGGRKLIHASAEMRDGEGRLIATASGVYKRVPEDRL